MPKFVSNNPNENATLEQARQLVKQRALVILPSYGIFANAQGSQEIIPEADFAPNKIDPKKPACLLIKWADRERPEDSASVDAFDDYVSVGQTINSLSTASSLAAGVISMIENELTKSNVVFQPGEAQRRIHNIKAVSKASDSAFEREWKKA